MKNLAIALAQAKADFKRRSQHLNTEGKLLLQLLEMGSQFKADFTAHDALQFVKSIEPYNRIKNLPNLIENINHIVPRCNYGLPEGQRPPSVTYRIGNENSLVIYVILNSDAVYNLGALQLLGFVDKIEQFAKEAGADEIHRMVIDPKRSFSEGLVMRLWWD